MSEKFARLSHVDDLTKFIMSEESTHTMKILNVTALSGLGHFTVIHVNGNKAGVNLIIDTTLPAFLCK